MSWIQHHTACFETTTIAQKTCRRKHEVPSCQEPSTQFRFLSKRKGSSMCRRESPHWSNQLKHCSVILEWRLSLHESIYIYIYLYIYTETNFKGLKFGGSDFLPIWTSGFRGSPFVETGQAKWTLVGHKCVLILQPRRGDTTSVPHWNSWE